jgi:hypothetical protein
MASEWRITLDITRDANREAQKLALQYRSRQEAMLDGEMIEDKLNKLVTFIGSLKRTPEGAAEIRCRIKLFGECRRSLSDPTAGFYAKLRHWLDRTIPCQKHLSPSNAKIS